MNSTDIHRRRVRAHHGEVAVRLQGNPENPAVVMTHSILSSASMWGEQAALLAAQGWYVVRIDTTGHGDSPTPTVEAVTMDGLASDTVAVMDALGIARAHYVGLSLGGMSGFGLGIHHGARILSLVLCDARADAPPAVAAPWDERIALAERHGTCEPLAAPTIERWFGKEFVTANRKIAERFQGIAATTSVKGFVACARAIQGLEYLADAAGIATPVTLIVGSNDGVLPDAMRDLQQRIAGSALETIPNAGHLPNVDQPAAFNAALLRHFEQVRK
ncbi:3-oxoadipate enol-lactonase [Variovorax sp. HW608]|uniref:alpha/beta fold hydrolase n=1 Tax=Variovorax sp. HW608 TaxID=1034889 RepID=UPI0008200D35|nr:alpha/beta hydrolase [Variovorax sp. HW608]SCK14414.1 3-oxoadipate enol-lactonase [Variovorax sp. HW608]